MFLRYVNIALVSGPFTNLNKKFFLAQDFWYSFLLHLPPGWGSGTLWRALEVGGMWGLTMCVDAA
jgi:hypothetical protein